MAKSNEPILVDDQAFAGLQITYMSARELAPYANNARTHSEQQIEAIQKSFRQFGFTNPVLLDGKKGLIAGHGRIIAALGMFDKDEEIAMCDGDRVPTIDLSHLTPAQQRAYVIADNQLATLAGWDYNLLKIELEALAELGFELDLLGFGEQLAELLAPTEGEAGLTDDDDCPEPPADPISVEGDVWILGRHRVMCGDSTSLDAVEKLMAGTRADILHTDPPYGVSYDGKGGSKKWEMIKNDATVGEALNDFLLEAFSTAAAVLKAGAAWYIWHGYKGTREFYGALHALGKEPSAQIIWVKNGLGTMWSDYRPKHEVCIYIKGAWYAGRDQSTVWNVDRERDYVHPTQKPVELVQRCLENSSKAGDAVLDLFGGSGSTLITCQKTGRHAYLMELDPRYVDTIVLRWQAFTGQNAVLEGDGRTFTEVLAERKPNAVLTPQTTPAPKKPKRERAKATA